MVLKIDNHPGSTALSSRILAEGLDLGEGHWSMDDGDFIWSEGRGDRNVLVRAETNGGPARDFVADQDVRAELNYGGGDYAVGRRVVFFIGGGRLWRQSLDGGPARPLTPSFGKAAAPALSREGRWIVYIHRDEDDVDRVAAVDAEGRYWPVVLSQADDFCASPAVSPDGQRLAWIAWNHPDQPWISSKLCLATLAEGPDGLPRVANVKAVAGGRGVSVCQPEFTPDGKSLLFVADDEGWGRLGALDLLTGWRRWLTTDAAEYGLPGWRQGQRRYAACADNRFVVAARGDRGFDRLVQVRLIDGHVQAIADLAAFTKISQITAAPRGARIAFVGSGPATPPRLVVYDFYTRQARVLARSERTDLDLSALAPCEAMKWETAGGETAHGLYYPPAGAGPASGRPPLVVLVHGGPTAQERAGWCPEAQFFATRGFAVLQVNYRGSTGYGRDYMTRLHLNWGRCDVEDVVSGARRLAEGGRVDFQRMAVLGASAGGFTVLAVMARHPEVFAAGVVIYGVCDLLDLAPKMPKFESRYLEWLLGPLPKASQIYRERSPLYHADAIRRPLAIFQGSADEVVPQAQAEAIVAALRHNGTPHIYHVYDGEGHGWRRNDTIEHYYSSVEDFLNRYVAQNGKE